MQYSIAVIGNPPYSGHSANRSWEILPDPKTKKPKKFSTFIGRLLQDYYFVDGKPLGEKNPKWLQNDYVKFIRWGQWRIGKTGAGILAFITDHSYLDSPTFRGMRQQLMQAFDSIYILDLHGNSKKQETCPDGSPDRNVFDIQQGVAIGIFVREPDSANSKQVSHADLYGVRETEDKCGGKYPWLFEHDITNTPWREIFPQTPLYLFKPQDGDLCAEYDRGWNLPEIMLAHNMGVTTGVDAFATAYRKQDLKDRITDLAGEERASALREKYGLRDTSSFSLAKARKWAKEKGALSAIIPIGYRVFDGRFVINSSSVLARSREDIFRHVAERANRVIATFRAIRQLPWRHAFVSDEVITKEYLSTLDNCYAFPLYLYASTDQAKNQGNLGIQFSKWPAGKGGRRPNLNPECVADLQKRLGLSFVLEGKGNLEKTFGPEDVFNYIYAVFHSPTYRSRYAEFLKSDFPRVPLTSDVKLFCTLCGLGAELVAQHLLESPKLEKPVARYPVKGSNVIEKGFPKYVAPGQSEPGMGKPVKDGRVYIGKGSPKAGSKGQYFEGVPPEVWNFHIGGYQVCKKWLKDRRGRRLTYDDQMHYCKVLTALAETICLMAEIDAAIPTWPIE